MEFYLSIISSSSSQSFNPSCPLNSQGAEIGYQEPLTIYVEKNNSVIFKNSPGNFQRGWRCSQTLLLGRDDAETTSGRVAPELRKAMHTYTDLSPHAVITDTHKHCWKKDTDILLYFKKLFLSYSLTVTL